MTYILNVKLQNTTTSKGKQRQNIDKVLIIDDDDNLCFLTKILLEDLGIGNQILIAHDGVEAIDQLERISENGEKLPDVIMLDIKMPVMDGFEFLDEVTKSPKWDLSPTRIFISTSSILAKDKEKALQYPISGFITKPLTEDIIKTLFFKT